MKLTWQVPKQVKKDYINGTLKKFFFIVQDYYIGFGDYYLPLFCEYSRRKIQAGVGAIRFDNFAVQTVKLYAGNGILDYTL